MDQYKLQRLTADQRQWLYDAVIKMVISDKDVDDAEMSDLLSALDIRGVEVDKKLIDKIVRSTVDSIELTPFEKIEYDRAFFILIQIIRSSAVDGVLAEQEKKLIREIAGHLNFKEAGLDHLYEWTVKLAQVNAAEKELYRKMKAFHQN
ncbi:MAG: TerB family tellurite resistance protein [Deltaproteobacteria bacterium]|nr:TerB family tellurite resistance protein [Deltaproteobacteria bacterium]